MDYVKTHSVNVEEKRLSRWNTGQWYAGQGTLNFGLLFLISIMFQNTLHVFVVSPFLQGLGALVGIMSMLVAGFGGAVVAERPGANWKSRQRTVGMVYGVMSIFNALVNLGMLGFVAYLLALAAPEFSFIGTIFSANLVVSGTFRIVTIVSIIGMEISLLANVVCDIGCIANAFRL